MRAVILAAGSSRRLQTYTKEIPKCMLIVNGKRILQHQLDCIKQNNIQDVTIVVGYLKNIIIDYVKLNYSDLNVKFVENTEFLTTNTIYSLWLAKDDLLKDDIIYFNGDVVFHPDILTKLVESRYCNCLAISHKKCDEEEVKVIVGQDSRVAAISKKLEPKQCAGEFIGIGKFCRSGNFKFVEHLQKGIDNKLYMEYFEYAVDSMLNENPVYEIDITELPCIEIDFPEDLEAAITTMKW